MSDQLPMKPKKNTKGVSSYPTISRKKHQRSKFESAYSDKPQLAISGTKHRVTTPNGRILCRKMISKPISDFIQEQNNKRIGPDGRFIRSQSKQIRAMVTANQRGHYSTQRVQRRQNCQTTHHSKRVHSGEVDQNWSETAPFRTLHKQQPHRAR